MMFYYFAYKMARCVINYLVTSTSILNYKIQLGVKYSYTNSSMDTPEEREFGCDTRGNLYHKNDEEWLNYGTDVFFADQDR